MSIRINTRRGRRGGALILVYHLVARLPHDAFGTVISPETFAAHVELIARDYRPLRMSELADRLAEGALPPRAVAVTFDDGYANNLTAALPVLEARSVPASVFVATGYTGGMREFWWDELERAIFALADGGSPRRRLVSVAGERLSLDGGDPALAARRIWRRLHRLAEEEIEAALDELTRLSGIPRPALPRETHRPMTVEELRALSASGLIEIGAHTRSHPVLAALAPDAQRDEIAGSGDDLTGWLGQSPIGISYPYGEPGRDYTRASANIAAASGYRYGLSTRAGIATRTSPRYELPRFFVSDWTPEQFALWLDTRFRSGAVRASRKLVRTVRAVRQ